MDLPETVRVKDLGVCGDGVCHLPDGRKVFVAGAIPGDVIRIGPVKESREGLKAALASIVEASAERHDPCCPYFGLCGGCALQHINDEHYRAFKMRRVADALARAGLKAEQAEGPFVSPPGSRRRAVLSAKCPQAGQVQLGFNERASHRLAEIQSCTVLKPALVKLLPVLREFLPRLMREGESYDVAIAESGGLIDMLITVLGRQGRECDAGARTALQQMAEAGPIARVSWQASGFKRAAIIVKNGSYRVFFGGYAVEPPPGAFLQATEEGERALTGFAIEGLNKKGRVADLYAGCGTFTFALLGQGHKIDAFEGDAPALEALAAAGAATAKVRAMKRDLAREPLTFQELKIYDAAVIDPPRAGAQKQAEEIGRSAIGKVISISCNPDTFARDSAILVQAGFKLKRLRIVDQFLWTPHVEVAGLFTR